MMSIDCVLDSMSYILVITKLLNYSFRTTKTSIPNKAMYVAAY